MNQFGPGQVRISVPLSMMGLCDYCHKKPKFPPHDFCSKACGTKAKASPRGPPVCKQCGLRPAHKGHEFCGRNCASTWQATNGTIGTGSWYTPGQPQRGQQQFWNPMPPSQGRTLGDTFNGTPNDFKNFGPQGQQPPQMSRQSVSMSNHPFAQQVPGPVTSVRQISSPPVTPMSSGMTMGDLMPPGPPTPTTPGSTPQFFTPTTPTGPGLQDPNQGPPSYSVSGGDHGQDPDMEDLIAITNQDVGSLTTSRGQSQTQFPPQVNSPPTGAGGGGTWDPHNPKYFPSQSQPYTSSPFSGMSSTCRLNGCSKPVFVDRITRNRSEYCSQKHREEAVFSGQVPPCIMCQKMPKRHDDHFCSKTCREGAMRP